MVKVIVDVWVEAPVPLRGAVNVEPLPAINVKEPL
jgi:hypothetical protein